MFSRSLRLFMKYFIPLMCGQIILLVASIYLLRSVTSYILSLILRVSGFSYITVNNIGSILLHPISLLLLILLLFVLGIVFVYHTFYFIIYFTYIQNNQKPKVLKVYIIAFYHLFQVFRLKNIKILPGIYMLVFIWNVPLVCMLLNKIRFFRFFMDKLPSETPVIVCIILALALGLLLLFRNRLLILPSMLDKHHTYDEGVKDSISISKDRGLKAALYVIVWNVLISIIILIVYAFIMGLTILFVTGLNDKTLAVATFITYNDYINNYLFLIFYTLGMAGNIALITNMYHTYDLKKKNVPDTKDDVIYSREYSYKKIISVVVVALTFINFYFFYMDVRNGSPLDYMNLDKIQVTSHRGFSHDVPENTLPAIEKAIEEQADYVEVDVRVTKDGELVILHDNNLKRTTGLNKKIWDVTYAEIMNLDAGVWLSKEYVGTKIPTLREVLELSKGKVMLNLDLKYRNEEEELAQKVVALINEYEMEWQCVVTSTSLKCLEKIKEVDPEVRTGFITYQIYSTLYENEAVDFFSMKYNLVSKGVVREVHKNGKEIHVWTVNSKTEFERLERIGVDNIITDNPAYAKKVLYQESEQFFVTLLKIMME